MQAAGCCGSTIGKREMWAFISSEGIMTKLKKKKKMNGERQRKAKNSERKKVEMVMTNSRGDK